MICSRDRVAQLHHALEAVRSVLRRQDELIVVDSASADAGTAVVAASAGARVLRASEPGLGIARNIGWRAAARPVVAFTDDDCAPAPGWTAAVERAFADPRLAFAFGQVVAGAGGGEPLSVTGHELTRTFSGDDLASIHGHGANMSCRVAALAEIGGFDEALGAGGPFPAAEDTDIAHRLLRAGWLGAFVTDSSVTHDQWRDRRSAVRVMYRYGVGAGAVAVKAGRAGEGAGLLRRQLWDEGIAMAARHLRNGYEFGAVACIARAAGTVTGAARAARLPVERGMFRR